MTRRPKVFGSGDGDALGEGSAEGLLVGDALGEVEGDGDALTDGLGDGLTVGETVGLGDAEVEGDGEGDELAEGLADAEGLALAVADGEALGVVEADADADGEAVPVGDCVASALTTRLVFVPQLGVHVIMYVPVATGVVAVKLVPGVTPAITIGWSGALVSVTVTVGAGRSGRGGCGIAEVALVISTKSPSVAVGEAGETVVDVALPEMVSGMVAASADVGFQKTLNTRRLTTIALSAQMPTIRSTLDRPLFMPAPETGDYFLWCLCLSTSDLSERQTKTSFSISSPIAALYLPCLSRNFAE